MYFINLIILLVSFLISVVAFATVNLNPGLWEVKTTIKENGKAFDPHAKMEESMSKMSPEQRKKMEAMLDKIAGNSKNGTKLCYTQEYLNDQDALTHRKSEDCETHYLTKTSKHMVVDFKCQNGSSGKGEWTVQDRSHYIGKMTMKKANGMVNEVDYEGKRLTSDCGEVPPLKIHEAHAHE